MSIQLDNSDGIIQVHEKLKEQADHIEELEAQLAVEVACNKNHAAVYTVEALKKQLDAVRSIIPTVARINHRTERVFLRSQVWAAIGEDE